MSFRHQTARTSLGRIILNAPDDRPNSEAASGNANPEQGRSPQPWQWKLAVTTWMGDWSIWRDEQGRAAYTAMAVLALGKPRFQIGPACDRLRQSLPTASDCLGSRPPHVLECLDLMSSSIQAQPSHEGVLARPPFSRVAISESPQNSIANDTDAFHLGCSPSSTLFQNFCR